MIIDHPSHQLSAVVARLQTPVAAAVAAEEVVVGRCWKATAAVAVGRCLREGEERVAGGC
jgi:hypothetical protein